jgi:hypothetical protein
MNKLSTINKWRNIVELSDMSNNDEVVLFSNEELTQDTLPNTVNKTFLYNPTLKLSRPVFDFEIKEGLNINFQGPTLDWDDENNNENPPEITKFLDAYFLIKQKAQFHTEIFKSTPSKFLARHIAYSFYDCMSGGMPIYELMICRLLAKDERIDKSTDVYPSSKGETWTNLNDFLNETNDCQEKYGELFNQLLSNFTIPQVIGKVNE